MSIFDRFRRKKQAPQIPPPAPAKDPPAPKEPEKPSVSPEPDITATLLLRKNIGWDAVVKAIEEHFGSQVLGNVEDNGYSSFESVKAKVPAATVTLEGVEFWCSYLAMPHPTQICDFSKIEDGLFSYEEREEIEQNQAFLVLAQKGGGQDLASKRQVCRLFTRLAGTLMGLEDAAGIYVCSAELLISRSEYLKHAGILEENRDDPSYFPVPVWVALRRRKKGEHVLTGTWGLRQFGLLELWFLDEDTAWTELYQRLYLLSITQITGRDFYEDMDTIEFTPGKTSLFRELNGALFIKEID